MVLFLTFVGMPMVGAISGLVVSGVSNLVFRAGPPKLRVPFTVLVWLAFCGLLADWLLHEPYDYSRVVPLIAIVAFCGLVVGPYHAELFVGTWFYKRRLKVIEAERDQKLAQIERDQVREKAELQQQFQAERDARLDEQERANAIRTYLRS